MNTRPHIIAVTGTKGKSTISKVLGHCLKSIGFNQTLQLDTHGVYYKDKRVYTQNESIKTNGISLTVCPGRFMHYTVEDSQPLAILEASIGCARFGLGYRTHAVGIFANVYDDHIGTSDYLKSRDDLAKAKSFIFSSIHSSGWAVYNADDALVTSQLSKSKPDVKRIAVSLKSDVVKSAELTATVNGDKLIIIDQNYQIIRSVPIESCAWLLNGMHEPTLYNALLSLAALHAYGEWSNNFKLSDRLILKAFSTYKPEINSGRMVIGTADSGATVILDYAHEKQSLKHLADYAANLKGKGGKTWGVVRLSEERPTEHIINTSKSLKNNFDHLIIYDKIDGYYKKPVNERAVGEVSQIMYDTLSPIRNNVKRIVREDKAIKYIAQQSSKDDIICIIVSSPQHTTKLVSEILGFSDHVNFGHTKNSEIMD